MTNLGRALAIVMRRGFTEIIACLVRRTDTATGDTPLHLAARTNDEDAAEWRIANGEAIDAENRIGYTPLMEAAREGNAEIASRLLAAGAVPTHRGNDLGMRMTALHHAADRDRAEIAGILLATGLDVDQGNAIGTTPLAWGLGEGSFKTAAVLLDVGANPAIENEHGFSALDMAEYVDDPEFRRRLVEAAEPTSGADPS